MPVTGKGREEAEARFARAQKAAEDSRKAMKEHLEETARIDANTAKLRALRLAKEAADREEALPAKAKPKAKKKAPANA